VAVAAAGIGTAAVVAAELEGVGGLPWGTLMAAMIGGPTALTAEEAVDVSLVSPGSPDVSPMSPAAEDDHAVVLDGSDMWLGLDQTHSLDGFFEMAAETDGAAGAGGVDGHMGVAGLSLLPDDPENAVAVASSAVAVAVAANGTTIDLIVETLTGPKVNGVKAVAARINGVCKDGTNRLLRFSNACWNTAGAAPANNTSPPAAAPPPNPGSPPLLFAPPPPPPTSPPPPPPSNPVSPNVTQGHQAQVTTVALGSRQCQELPEAASNATVAWVERMLLGIQPEFCNLGGMVSLAGSVRCDLVTGPQGDNRTFPMYTYPIQVSNISEAKSLVEQLSKTLNTTTPNGILGDLLCNSTLNPPAAEYCSYLGQGTACVFTPYDPVNIKFCGLPPKPDPAIADVAFVVEAVACPLLEVTKLLPEWEGFVQGFVPVGYNAVVVEVICEELNGNAQFTARYEINAAPFPNPSQAADSFIYSLQNAATTLCSNPSTSHLCTLYPGSKGLAVCAQALNPMDAIPEPLYCSAAGGSMVVGLFVQEGRNVTCGGLSAAAAVERVAADVLSYVVGLKAYSQEVYWGALPAGEVQCSSMGRTHFSMRFKLTPTNPSTTTIMDIADTLGFLSQVMVGSSTAPCNLPAAFCSYMPSAQLCAPSVPSSRWDVQLDNMLTSCF